MQAPPNPDTRPLPPGWHQQYDLDRQSWYYIQINVLPPKVSYTHPAGLGSFPSTNAPISMPATPSAPPSEPQPTIPRVVSPPMVGSRPSTGSKLSLAQQMYASAINKKNPANNYSMPVGSVNVQSPPSVDVSRLPPLSPISPPLQVSAFPDSASRDLEPAAIGDLYSNIVSAQRGGGGGTLRSSRPASSHNFGPVPISANTSTVHRSQSYQPISHHNEHHLPHRATTIPATQIHSLNKNNNNVTIISPTRPGDTPTICMNARPPPAGAQKRHQDTLPTPSPFSNNSPVPPPKQVASPPNTPYSSSTTSSPSTSSTLSTPNTSPVIPYQMQGQFKQNQSFTGAANNMAMMNGAQGTVKTAEVFRTLGMALARTTGAAVRTVASSVLQTTGISAILGISADLFVNILAGLVNNNSNTGVNMAMIAAVLQGQPGANYQAVINALLRQQQQTMAGQNQMYYQVLVQALQQQQQQISGAAQGQMMQGNMGQIRPQNQMMQQRPPGQQQMQFQRPPNQQPGRPQGAQMYQGPQAQQGMNRPQAVGQQTYYQGQQGGQQQHMMFLGQQQQQQNQQQGMFNGMQQNQQQGGPQGGQPQDQQGGGLLHSLLADNNNNNNNQSNETGQNGQENGGQDFNAMFAQDQDYTQPPPDSGFVPPEYSWEPASDSNQIPMDDGSGGFLGFGGDAPPADDGSGGFFGNMMNNMGDMMNGGGDMGQSYSFGDALGGDNSGGGGGLMDSLGGAFSSFSADFSISFDDS
ncbi:hypothetical protein AMATHDRAFT_60852 [Amanita thiersii Skay4041]|uniref:WW domain-containing protein n=1 Tax=Amanita thiersii Skay4041 TaxID=703135 RepID=A0A2A9NQH4_9AGAR|nr:hypothetical protein AMATHDRAFT_60852 [Amanita thiersii Skay4041]